MEAVGISKAAKDVKQPRKKKPIREQYSLFGVDADEYGWRPLGEAAPKDLQPMTQKRMQDIAFWLYDTNLMAHRIIEMTKDFVIGDGIKYQAQNAKVREIIKQFWDDPINNMDMKQDTKALEIGLYGEQIYPVSVNPINGQVRLGYVDPCQVKKVVLDKANCEIVREVWITGRKDALKVINIDEDTQSATYGKLVGDCFFFAINKVTSASRGRSDLLTLSDWIDGYEKFLFNRLERSGLTNVFFWDVELQGKDEKWISAWLKRQKLPKPGSIRAHNEKVKYVAVTPRLEGSDASEEAKMLRAHILGGAGYPPHWFAGGEGITRATALEMGTPVYKKLKARQKYFKFMIEYILRFAVDQAEIKGKLTKDDDHSFQVLVPRLLEKDLEQISTAIASMATTLMIAEEQGWITKENAASIFNFLIAHLGFDIELPIEKIPIITGRESHRALSELKARLELEMKKIQDIIKNRQADEDNAKG